jgi:hypothetical protein
MILIVRALEGYTNGRINGAVDWKAQETREVSMDVYQQLLRDHPTNWIIEGVVPPVVERKEIEPEPHKASRHKKG